MALVIAAAAILLSARTARMWLSASAIPATMPVDTLEHWRPIAAAGHWIGDAESEATVIMFSDYQCGYCASTDERLRRMVATSEGRLGISMRHSPLGMHGMARPAAIAAVCADRQQRFEPMNRLLFEHGNSLTEERFTALARSAGVRDVGAFEECLADSTADQRVSRDLAVADSLHIVGTPTLFIDGMRYDGEPSDLEEVVRWHLAGRPTRR